MPGDDDYEDYSHITDPVERRRIQNRNNSRRFRANQKEREEEERRKLENEKNAGGAYAPPDPDQMQEDGNESGLPWGSMPLGYMMSSSNEAKKSSSSQQGATGNADTSMDRGNEETRNSSTKGSASGK